MIAWNRIAAAAAICCSLAMARADDWATYLGPKGNGTSDEKGLLPKWPEGGPKVLWRAPIGQGWSCPSISGNEVFLIEAKGKVNSKSPESVRCLNVADGQEKWAYTYPNEKYYTGWWQGGPRSTPTDVRTPTELICYDVAGKAGQTRP